MRVGIVGAGVAGLCTAKTLRDVGHDVVVWDRTPDVGGVWSASRRYPGVSTQSAKDTYAFSDHPMPAGFPEWPSGAQVQEYLAGYAAATGVDAVLRLRTEVRHAAPAVDGGWDVTLTHDGATRREHVDHLVVANGVFSIPHVPAFDGLEEFTAANGRLCSACELLDAEQARDRHTVVVGYGKSACDVAVAISDVAASTTVVARQLLWKVPRRIAGVLNFKHLLLTRLGEALFRYRVLQGFEKVLHGPLGGLPRRMLDSLGPVSVRQFGLAELGLVPRGDFADIVRGAIGLTTEGFFEGVRDGVIDVHRDTRITRLLAADGVPHAELADGTVRRVDLVVCATGFRQEVPFLDEAVAARLRDERGNFVLYRQILPLDVADLSFAGYNSSFFSPLNAEMAAVWLAALLGGALELPDTEAMRVHVTAQLAFMDDATDTHHSHGTKIIPFSLHNVDEVLGDLGLDVGRAAKLKQWLGPVDPGAYRGVAPRLAARLGAVRSTEPRPAPVLPSTA